MHDSAVQLFQKLVKAGAIPGKDFSCDSVQQVFHVSERCIPLLQNLYPEVDWETFLAPYRDQQLALVSAIHQQLGCPFVETLVQRMVVRCQALSDDQAAWYLQQVLGGVEQRTGLRLLPLLNRLLLPDEQLRFDWLLQQERVECCHDWLYDLILAAGGTNQDVMISGQEVLLSETGVRLLEMVWVGAAELSLELSEQP